MLHAHDAINHRNIRFSKNHFLYFYPDFLCKPDRSTAVFGFRIFENARKTPPQLLCTENVTMLLYFETVKTKKSGECFETFLTTSRWLTCIHAKLFPTVKRRTCIHVLRHYSRNSYFGRHAIFSESSGSRLGDHGQKALQTTIEHTLFVDFCLIPLSNTCSFVRPARNVYREIFIHRQEGFCVGKFVHVVDQAMLENRPLRKDFRGSRLCHKRQALLKL